MSPARGENRRLGQSDIGRLCHFYDLRFSSESSAPPNCQCLSVCECGEDVLGQISELASLSLSRTDFPGNRLYISPKWEIDNSLTQDMQHQRGKSMSSRGSGIEVRFSQV